MAPLLGNWHPGIGDPTAGGWLIAFAYFGAAWLAWKALAGWESQRSPRSRRFWQFILGAMLVLGVNKQLDLQTAFTNIGRWLAWHQGWYADRRGVQVAFIALLLVGGVALLVALLWWLRPLSRAQQLGLAGLCALGAFVMIRAASFHHVDMLLGLELGGLRVNWLLEGGSIAVIAAGAAMAAGLLPRRR
jgi:hypothetical protein